MTSEEHVEFHRANSSFCNGPHVTVLVGDISAWWPYKKDHTLLLLSNREMLEVTEDYLTVSSMIKAVPRWMLEESSEE